LPLPELPALIVIQFAWLAAVHEQPVPATTATLPEPPAAGTSRESGLRLYVQELPCMVKVSVNSGAPFK
jgi:hypothetical protein